MRAGDLEYLGKSKSQKSTSMTDDSKRKLEEIRAYQEHWKRYGTNRSSKAAKSKREIMEELTR